MSESLAAGHRQWSAHLPAGAEAVTLDLLAEESLPRAWTARWRESPASPVLLSHDGEVVSGAALEERSRAVAARFAGAGLVAGDRVLLSAAPSADLVVAY